MLTEENAAETNIASYESNDGDEKDATETNDTNNDNDNEKEAKKTMKEEEEEEVIGAMPPKLGSRQRSISVEDEKEDENSTVLVRLLDKDQDVVEKTKNKKNKESKLNKVDPDWDYNITMGDVEKRRIKNLPGKDPDKEYELWFPIKDSVRKVFIALKVKRVSDVDNVAETV